MMKRFFLFALLLASGATWAQNADEPIRLGSLDAETSERLSRDVEYLASDGLEGRQPGTRGADLARDYILEAFTQHGLLPYFGDTYLQPFSTPRLCEYPEDGNRLGRGRREISVNEGFGPTPLSSTGEVKAKTVYVRYGIVSPEAGRDDYGKRKTSGRIVVMDAVVPAELKKTHGRSTTMWNRVVEAKNRGAVAVIFIHRGLKKGQFIPPYRSKWLKDSGIPVAYVSNRRVANKLRRNRRALSMQCTVVPRAQRAENVVGLLNLGQPQTVVIGAHYDHVGYGREGGASDPERAGEIHNGADDNASGTAVLMELVRQISSRPELHDRNYVFIAFSGEEDGLVGSKTFTNSEAHLQGVEYMINLDMVGRLAPNDSLTVYATGSAEQWPTLLDDINGDLYELVEVGDLFPRSDHANFIRNGVPAVMFFTGFHGDYHSPDDDFDMIDSQGMVTVVETVLELIRRAQSVPEFMFANPTQVE